MNAIRNNELVATENNTEVVHETEDALVEVGAVSETRTGIFGSVGDNGGGFRPF
jgi:hypothetical protein